MLFSQETPEGGMASYSYWDFDSVKKRVDARNVETHYEYDTLNRLEREWYTGLGGDDTGSVKPVLLVAVNMNPVGLNQVLLVKQGVL